ncbi:MAG TPA: flagellar hook protein FliD [Betaproteobacteria bacterium]|nr:flagellar hook protein FliD [Betaproteobacteria bacterium]
MAISSPGIGSNLDVNSIVSQLMAIEKRPLGLLAQKEASFQAKLSAYGTLQGALSTFQSSVNALSSVSKYNSLTATAADTTVLGATASSSAVAGQYSVEVQALAQSQKITSAGFASTSSAIGTGSLTFEFGTISGGTLTNGVYSGAAFTLNPNKGAKTVTIDAAHDSLAGVRDAVNAANIGVTATIVNDGTTNGNKLVFTSSDTGVANSLKISTVDAGLSTYFAYDPAGTQNMTQAVQAQDASLVVDGIGITKSTNTVTDAIQGVTLNLLKTNTGAPTTLTVARDTTSITSAVGDFVKAYNDINKSISDLTAYNATTKKGAILQGDFSTLTIQRRIRQALSSTIQSLSGGQTSLSSIGVSFQKDGTLALDSTKLQSAISANPADIAGLFAATARASDSLVQYVSAGSAAQPGTYAVNVTQLAAQGYATGASAVGALTIDATNDTLSVTVDGVAATITLNQATYATSDQLAAEIQSKINGASALSSAGISVKVTQAAGVFTITSDRYGSASNASVTGGNGITNLMGATYSSGSPTYNIVGKDVAGTINGITATGSGQYLTGASGTAVDGLKLQISGGLTGDRGTVTFTQGYAYKLDQLATSLLSSNGPINSRTDGINRSINDITKQRDDFNRRLVDIEARYRRQFSALDGLIGTMNQTSTYLAQQLANLPKIGGVA